MLLRCFYIEMQNSLFPGSADSLVFTWALWAPTAPSSGPAPERSTQDPGPFLCSLCRPGLQWRCQAWHPLSRLGLRLVSINPEPPRRDQDSPVPFPLTSMCLAASRHFQRMDWHTPAKEKYRISCQWGLRKVKQ